MYTQSWPIEFFLRTWDGTIGTEYLQPLRYTLNRLSVQDIHTQPLQISYSQS